MPLLFTPFDGFTLFPALMSAALTAYNLVAWPRDHRLVDPHGRVSVLIPARNEIGNIGGAVGAALAALRAGDELIVCDDGSDDGTRELLATLQTQDTRLQVLDGLPLPAGQVGKPRACQQLSDAATGDLLVFVDADVRLAPDALARLGGLMAHYDAGLLTGMPHQVYGTLAERVVMPFLRITFTSWIPLDAIWRSSKVWMVAAIGQVVAVRRDAYDRIGGFASVAHEVVDDVAFGRRAKALGVRVVFATLDQSASCRMYTGPRTIWEGFSKNMFEGLGGRWSILLTVLTLYLSAFVLPFVRLAVELATDTPVSWETVVAIGANIAMRMMLAVRYGDSPLAMLLHPVGALWVSAMGLNSARWSLNGRVRWRGRTYARRDHRQST